VLADSPDMELADLVPSLKRAVAPPGQFAALFPESTDNDLADLLADAVAEAQLDGFLATNSLALDTAEVTPDLTTSQQALVVLYGAGRVLYTRIANLKNRTRYKAGAAEAETEQSASVLVELLRQTNTRKKQILDDAKYGRAGMSFAMVDLYVSKSIDLNSQDVGYITPGWR
jgi:hypothetical protein